MVTMQSKIAGFILSARPLNYMPVVNRALKTKTITGKWGYLTLYSAEDEVLPVSENVWSLGFPAHQSLLKHNLLLTVEDDQVIVENDWIGGIPVYFNRTDRIISTFPEVCPGKDPQIDEEGLYLFLKYGFSALGTTPFANVATLRYYSALHFGAGKLEVKEKEDPALSVDLSQPADEEEIWNLLHRDIENVLDNTSGVVVSPLSGGYDSRIINALVPERHKSRIKTYSYGLSPNQTKSFEARIAHKVADKLGLEWEQIILDNAFNFIEEWHDLFGFGTHLHGMMHIEFYQKILNKLDTGPTPFMFSGISGSAFQGGHPPAGHVSSPKEIYNLALTHGLNCSAFLPAKITQAETKFFEQNRELLSNLKWYPVLTMRIKMNLLHYLYKLPAVMGISSTSPYHNFEIATKMLSLPEERRKNRLWVGDYFRKQDLVFKNRSRHGDTRNTLNRHLFLNHTFEPLRKGFLKETPISDKTINLINKELSKIGEPGDSIRTWLTTTRVVKEVLKRAGIKDRLYTYMPAYQTLKSFEKTLKKHR